MLWLARYTPRIVRSTSPALALTLIVAAACADRVPTAPHKTTTQRASADISPSLFDSLWVTPSEVNAGDVATGTIVLHQPAPPGGAHILIRNYNYRVATWDSNLVVPQGYTRMNFTIQTHPVPTNLGDQLDAYWAGSHVSAYFSVMFVPAPGITVTPMAIGWGPVALGNGTSGRVVKITNSGNVTVTVSSLTLGGANPGDFPIVSDACTGASLAPTSWLAPGASCTAYVSFEPQRIGTRTATITIAHSAGAPVTVSLSGTGARGSGGYVP
jgi:hypothetical protein